MITRAIIKIKSVESRVLKGKVGYVRIKHFNRTTSAELESHLAKLKKKKIVGLVLDLYNNPGGLLRQAINVTSQFLTDGYVLQQEDADGNRQVFRVREGGAATEIPVVVLINRGSASSSEIFAGALQDHERAVVVGETTFGTGTVLQPFRLDDGSTLMLGTSQWLTADGRLIRKQGIQPDVEVELEIGVRLLTPSVVESLSVEELRESEDAQLLKALELLEALP